MPYVDKMLAPGEAVRYVGKISIWTIVPRMLLGFAVFVALTFIAVVAGSSFGGTLTVVVAVVAGLLIWAFIVFTDLIDYLTTEIVITNQRIVSKHGWLSITTTSTDLDKVNNINVAQPLIGRILGYGNVEITTATAEEKDNHRIDRLAAPSQFDIALRTELEQEESKNSRP